MNIFKRNKIGAWFSIVAMLIVGFSAVHPALADESISDKLAQTKADLDKLQKVEDDMTLPSGPKQQMETSLRREIIGNVLDVSLSQLEDAQNQLASTTFPGGDEWANVSSYLSDSLSQDESYYNNTRSNLENNQNMTPSDLKDMAKSLEAMKTGTIDKDVARANSVIAALNIDGILSVADDRLSKVGTDVNKIYANNLTKNQSLKTLYAQASDNIKSAHGLSDDALQSIVSVYTSTTTTSTQDFSDALKQKILGQKIASVLSIFPKTDTSTIRVTQDDIDSYISNDIASAYNDIKSAYDIFVNMSVNVKKFIQ